MSNADQYKYEQAQGKKNKEAVNVAAIVKVTAFDAAKMTVNVQPLSKRLEQGSYQSQPPILSVPIAVTKGGGFVFRPWYSPGDVGVVLYIDHDIDKAVADGSEGEPNTERNHSTSDAVFVGGIVPGNSPVSGIPSDAIAIGTADGSCYVAVKAGGIEIKGDITLTGKMTASDDVTASGISLMHHTHGGVQSGSGNTGQPQ